MKQILLICCAVLTYLSFQSCSPQRLRDKALNIKYVQLPEERLPDEWMTYSVMTEGPLFMKTRESREEFRNSFTMDGFRRIDAIGDKAGHLRISVFLDDISAAQPEFRSETRTTKDKEGNEVTNTYYFYEFAFANFVDFQIISPEGDLLETGSVKYERVYESDKDKISANVRKNRNKYYNEFEREFAEAALNNAEYKIKSILDHKFDFRNERVRHELFLTRNHSSEGQFEKHYEMVKEVFENADYATSSEDLLAQLAPSLDYYHQYADTPHRGNENMKRIYRAANYNLALIYMYCDDFEKAEMYAERVIASEGKDAKSRRILRAIDRHQARMDVHEIYTLHHFRDLENALGPKRIAELDAAKIEMMNKNYYTDGVVKMNGQEIEGTLTLSKEADDFVFGTGGNVKFMIEENSEMIEIDLTSPEVTAFQIANRKFEKIRFTPYSRGKQEATYQILELVYDSDRVKLLKYYPMLGALSDESPELALQKEMQVHPLSLESTQFLMWEKGLSEYFSDCKDLVEMINNGEIKKNKDDLLKAARIYAEVCYYSIKP